MPDQEQLTFTFSENFLLHHAGRIVSDPLFAIVELVANSWDAGADRVDITWASTSGQIVISDNGTGMTRNEFTDRWTQLNYNRVAEQGVKVIFPEGVRNRSRVAFGRNGVGRHAMFAFSPAYRIETKKGGKSISAVVTRTSGQTPYAVNITDEGQCSDHGTVLSASVVEMIYPETKIIELIGARFIADPEFRVSVNGREVTMTDLEQCFSTEHVSVEGYDDVIVHRFDASAGRTTRQNGVAWWVNKRLVGNPSWEGFEGKLLDGRGSIAKRYTYVVEANHLLDNVKADWSGFRAADRVNATFRAIYDHIAADLSALQHGPRRVRKADVVKSNRELIERLPTTSRNQLSTFIDEIQEKCPTLRADDLDTVVRVLATLETSRTGYALLGKLASLDPHDVDSLNQLLDEWSVADAKRVLDELHYRLELIKRLETLVEDSSTDELHDLQPIFERGLWIFGPEFESINFTSNRTLAKVVEAFFDEADLTTPRKRPDFVTLPHSSIGIYASDAYGDDHEIRGFEKIVIVELKKGGWEIKHEEIDQARHYAKEIRRSGKVGMNVPIIGYVL